MSPLARRDTLVAMETPGPAPTPEGEAVPWLTGQVVPKAPEAGQPAVDPPPAEDTDEAPKRRVWLFLFKPRWLAWHLFVALAIFGMLWLGDWQYHRALGGNGLSWAYTFEWPLFAGYAVYIWWQLIHDQTTALNRRKLVLARADAADQQSSREPGWALSGGHSKSVAIAAGSAVDERHPRGERFTEQTPEEAEALAAYNRYLAGLDADADADADAGQR
jgi:hypothetical protein